MILLDLNMPDIDGYGSLGMVRADPRLADIPMIMLTSSAQRGEAERSQQAGIVAYLTKPVRSTQLRIARCGAIGQVRAAERQYVPSPPRPRCYTRCRCLLVEDNAVNQKVVHRRCSPAPGIASTSPRTGSKRSKHSERSRYVAVFMDCQMPVMDGYETTAANPSARRPAVNELASSR